MQRNLSVIMHPRELGVRRDWPGVVCVVADILRATTTMAWTLHFGAARIKVFADVKTMLQRARNARRRSRIVLRGERRCMKVRGMNLGNSPLEGGCDTLAGKTVWMATTNGTPALLAAKAAEKVWAGSFNTLTRTARAARNAKRDVCIVCAGRGGDVSVEDVLFAGMLVDCLGASRYALDEPGWIAYHFYRDVRNRWRAVMSAGEAAAMLRRCGLQHDVETAQAVDSLPEQLCEFAKGWVVGA